MVKKTEQEQEVKPVEEVKPAEEVLNLDQFLALKAKEENAQAYLLASFKYEARFGPDKSVAKPKSLAAWESALKAQAIKTYE